MVWFVFSVVLIVFVLVGWGVVVKGSRWVLVGFCSYFVAFFLGLCLLVVRFYL